jgi:hypothetical protein
MSVPDVCTRDFGYDEASSEKSPPDYLVSEKAITHQPRGYGIYYSRPTGQAFYQNVFGAPFSVFRLNAGEAKSVAASRVGS